MVARIHHTRDGRDGGCAGGIAPEGVVVMAEVEVRALRAGDGAGCARAWLDAARYYVDMEPENFQMPAEEGLAGWFERDRGTRSSSASTSPDRRSSGPAGSAVPSARRIRTL
jgi:hypothetical protein